MSLCVRDIPNHEQAILFFQCKVSKSRHIVGGHGPVKSLAFVKSCGRFNHPRDGLTF